MSSLKLTFFGSPRIELNGAPLELKTRKALALLAYLVVTQHAHSRDTLASIFWPESPSDRASANLRDALWHIKKQLPDDWLDIRRHEVAIKESPGLWVDVLEFQQQLTPSTDHAYASDTACAECVPSLLAALDLYQDDFLRGFTLPDCSAFDDWQASQTDLLREQLIDCFRKIIAYATSQRDLTHARQYTQRWVALCPWSEAAHRELMRVYALAHQRSAALQQYQACVRMLQEEFEAEPEHETQELYEAILSEDLTPGPSPGRRGEKNLTPRPPLLEGEQSSLSLWERVGVREIGGEVVPPPHNLPAQTTTFIGRETEVAAVSKLLSQPDIRLLTLTGAGGTGKTRLGLQVAAELLEGFQDGIFFVSLAPISNPDLVIPTIVQTLGLQVAGNAIPLNVLKTYLQQKQLLLILDNFEQILDTAPVLIDLLAAAPELKILVTSRVVLHLSGEHEYLVPPLKVPAPTHLPSLERLTQSEAVRLFAERAQAVHPDFTLTEETTPAVAEICGRLDGLPLAIELAAARIRMLTLQEMRSRLDYRLRFLTGGARDLPARQRTIRGTIEWSYELLEDEGKTLFHRLGVFVGGWTLNAAQSVCPLHHDIDVFSGLESLVDHNLIIHDEREGQSRFSMLETIREYALERLAESSEEDAIREQHARFFLVLAEEAESCWQTAEQAAWLARLDVEHNNLRAALTWSVDHALEISLRLGGALEGFWNLREYSQEGRDWLARALAKSQMSGTGLERWRAKALAAACLLAWLQGDFRVACSLGEASVTLWRTLGDPFGLAYALHMLASSTAASGDRRKALSLLEECITLCRQSGDTKNLSMALERYGWELINDQEYERARTTAEELLRLSQKIGNILAQAGAIAILGSIATSQKDYSTAQSLYENCLKLVRGLEDSYAIAEVLAVLGVLSDMQGDYERARTCYAEGLERSQKRGNEFEAAWQLSGLGRVALHQHHWQTARTHLATSLTLFQKRENSEGVAACVIGLAGVAEAQGHAERAAQLLGAREPLPEISRGHFHEDIVVQAEYDRILAAVRAALGEEAFAAALAKGRTMTLEQAIEYALAGFQQNSRNKT